MIKVQINGRTLNKKGLAALALATTVAVSAVFGIGYKAVETFSDSVVASPLDTTVEVYVEWGSDNSSVWDAIHSVNPEINNIKAKQVMDMVHELNGTGKYTGHESDMPAGKYLIPVIE